MPSKNTTIRHLSRSLTQSALAVTFGSRTDQHLHAALDQRSREIYDNSPSKRRLERRSQRLKKQYVLQTKRARQRPKPLSAKDRRKLCFDEIPKEERSWDHYEVLRRLWRGYMREILGLDGGRNMSVGGSRSTQPGVDGKEPRKVYLTPIGAGPILASADLHGAVITCVRSRCVSRVGVKGVIVQDRKFVFVVITEKNEMKTLPKEHSIFQFTVPVAEDDTKEDEQKDMIFEIHGEQFQNRAPDRGRKQFKQHYNPDL